MRTSFYCQHSLGIGHLMRTLRLAESCLEHGPVLLIAGGSIPRQLHVPAGVEVCQLPPLRMTRGRNQLEGHHGETDIERIFRERRPIALAAIANFRPDVLVVEMFPFGRKKFAAEILAIAEVARRLKAQLVCSVRDVLVTRRSDQDRFDRRATDWLNEYFNALLIHSDPQLVTLDQTLSTFDQIGIPTYYTGYIGGKQSPPVRRDRRLVASAGGGRVGAAVIETVMQTSTAIKQHLRISTLIVTGPHGQACSSVRNGVQLARFINDFPATLSSSMVSVSQCGYNTAVEILQTGTPAVFVPYEDEQEDEQLRRAEMLQKKGCGVVLREAQLNRDALLHAIEVVIVKRGKNPVSIDLGGAARSSELIREIAANA